MAISDPTSAFHSRVSEETVPARTTDRFKTLVTFDMPGATWDYVNLLHEKYKFHEQWPYGMLCHITGEIDAGISSIGLWRDRAVEQDYFRKVALGVITESINQIGPPPSDSAGGDFEPRERAMSNLVMTDLCDGFADIGEDVDGGAIHVLGTEPVLVTFPSGVPHSRPIEQLKLDGSAPVGLIIAWDSTGVEGTREHQVWSSEELAMQAVTDFEPELLPLKRISFGSSELHPEPYPNSDF
jgi:hypothetical protein